MLNRNDGTIELFDRSVGPDICSDAGVHGQSMMRGGQNVGQALRSAVSLTHEGNEVGQ